jgi:membrane protein insertase Oxa1/YidC/SpoIIIJ
VQAGVRDRAHGPAELRYQDKLGFAHREERAVEKQENSNAGQQIAIAERQRPPIDRSARLVMFVMMIVMVAIVVVVMVVIVVTVVAGTVIAVIMRVTVIVRVVMIPMIVHHCSSCGI